MTRLLFSFSLLLVPNLLRAADIQPLLDLVPRQATVLYGVNVAAALASPFGQQVYKRILANNPAFDRYGATLGFDPKRDLREVIFVSLGNTPPTTSVKLLHYDVILARGTFKPDRFLTVANLVGSSVTQDHGISIITPPASSLRTSFALVDSSTAIIGSVPALKSILEQRSGKTATGLLPQKALAASTAYDTWYATVTPFSQLLPLLTNGVGGAAFSSVLGAVRESSGGMKFRASDTVLAAEANTGSEAEALTGAAVLRAAIPLIRNPRTSALRNSQFAVTGSALKGTATLAEADMIRLFVRPPYSGTSPMKTSQPKR